MTGDNGPVTVRPARRELEIGKWTFWWTTDHLHITVHAGTLLSCLLSGYILGQWRSNSSSGGDGE